MIIMRYIYSIVLTLLLLLTYTEPGYGQKKEKKRLKAKDIVEVVVEDTLTNEFLDTLDINDKVEINDYSMIGFHYGAGLSRVMWNPPHEQDMVFIPINTGVTFTKYGKMFGYMPFFGFQAGLLYTKEGYQFEYDEENDYTYKVEGAEKAIMEVVEMPLLSHMHIDFWKMKLIANIGCYVGYRLSIERFPGKSGYVTPDIKYSFIDTDKRFDYGIKGGVGLGLMLDPVEFHITAMYKHSFSSLYEPDYYSEYYYRFAYPSNIVISAGLHFHLSKRSGKTKNTLKKAAKALVYETEDFTGNSR